MNETKLIGELDRIIEEERIHAVFQPIVSLQKGEVIGYEALSRIDSQTELANPERIFRLAVTHNRFEELERLCRMTALRALSKSGRLAANQRIFLNISPAMLSSKPFLYSFTANYLSTYGIRPDQVVLEITEREPIGQIKSFKQAISCVKARGLSIALDDVGTMFSGLMMIQETVPHFIKLDRQLIENVAVGKLNFAMVSGMIEFCQMSGIRMIAEGVETESELRTLIELGVPYAQGFYLRRPDRVPMEPSPEIHQTIAAHVARKLDDASSPSMNHWISEISSETDTVRKDTGVERAFDQLINHPNSIGFCVTENDDVIGIVTKQHMIMELSGRFGFSLYQHRTIDRLMDTNFISVDYRMPISAVSKLAMARSQDRLYDFIVVTKDNKYYGTVTIKNLLQRATEIEVAKAKYENPLTGLPGNLVIEQKMKQLLLPGNALSIVYLDINHFKEYNDVYGFEMGDRVIKLLADILVSNLPYGEFVGHIGGDDFVAILHPERLRTYCQAISQTFGEKARLCYSSRDRLAGYIVAENRLGLVEHFPLLSVSIAGIVSGLDSFANLQHLTEELAHIKKKSKLTICDHFLLIDWRRAQLAGD
ncbi:MAG: bifunctional diguanylate cyclase/phosphodiesterase [Sporolactobacillus sp.]